MKKSLASEEFVSTMAGSALVTVVLMIAAAACVPVVEVRSTSAP